MQIGTTLEKSLTVTPSLTAKAVGSGVVEVYATPMMIALMEGTAAACLQPFLQPDQTSVGTTIHTTHQAATPVGMKVWATATITAIEGRQITFDVEARDEKECIGKGTHTRFIVFTEKFDAKAKGKLSV